MDKRKMFEILDDIFEKKQFEEQDMNVLVDLAHSDDSEIRAYVADLLVIAKGLVAEQTLISLCGDDDELVRVNACDSLSKFGSEETYDALKKCAYEDSSDLVKQYAIVSIIDIMEIVHIRQSELVELFEYAVKAKQSHGLQIIGHKGLYLIGKKSHLMCLSQYLNDENYHIRCTAVNELVNVANGENVSDIRDWLSDLSKTEKTVAVQSTIDAALKQL